MKSFITIHETSHTMSGDDMRRQSLVCRGVTPL